MKRIKIAQIGTSANSHGSQIWTSLLKQDDIFEVAGYAFPENEREKFPKQAKYFESYREMTVEESVKLAEREISEIFKNGGTSSVPTKIETGSATPIA